MSGMVCWWREHLKREEEDLDSVMRRQVGQLRKDISHRGSAAGESPLGLSPDD